MRSTPQTADIPVLWLSAAFKQAVKFTSNTASGPNGNLIIVNQTSGPTTNTNPSHSFTPHVNSSSTGGDGGGRTPTNHYPTVSSLAADANGNEGDTLTITKASGAGTVEQGANGNWSWSLPTTDSVGPF